MIRHYSSQRLPWRGWWRRLGAGGRGSFLLVPVLVLGTAGLMVGNGNGVGPLAHPGAGLLFPVVGLLWAAGVAVAAGWAAWAYLAAGLWLGWHGVGLMGTWTGTPMAVLPLVWWLAVGLAVLAWRGPRRPLQRGVLWLAMAMGAGGLMAGPLGWGRLPGSLGETLLWGRLGLGLALAAVGWWLLPRLRQRGWTEPGFGKVLAGGLAVMAVGLGGSVLRDAEGAAGWAAAAVEATAFLGALGWFWWGGLAGAALVSGVERGLGAGFKMTRSPQMMPWVLPAVWLVVTGMEWMATRGASSQLPGLGAGLAAWGARWPAGLQWVAGLHFWLGVVVVVLGAGFMAQGRQNGRYLLKLNALWVAGFLGLLGVVPALSHQGSPPGGTFLAWGGPLVLLGVGMICWARGMAAETRGPENTARERRLGGLMIFPAGMLAAEIAFPGQWADLGGTAALLGMVHLALPLVLHRWWRGGHQDHDGLTLSSGICLGAVGLVAALPLLYWNTVTVSQMACGPLLWLPALQVLRIRQPFLKMASGALAGAILGSCTVAAWCRPGLLLPETPLISWLNPPASALLPMERPFLTPAHFTLLLLMMAAGGALGALVFRGKPGPGLPLMPLLADPAESAVLPPASS